jgi:hypothetical protein
MYKSRLIFVIARLSKCFVCVASKLFILKDQAYLKALNRQRYYWPEAEELKMTQREKDPGFEEFIKAKARLVDLAQPTGGIAASAHLNTQGGAE